MGVMDLEDIVDISYVDVRRRETNDTEIEKYIGIQRSLSQSRVKEISKYVNLVDASFPTAIILSVDSANAEYETERGVMRLKREGHVANILDGQHRVAGFEKANPKPLTFECNVAVFVDMDLEDQAVLFATINKSQTKVNKSLVADLFSFAISRSPQKTAHQIARALNEKEGSPFYGKIKVLGIADDREKETITQATFVEGLLKYISTNPMLDRDVYKRGKIPPRVSNDDEKRLFFRNLFIDEKDADIAQIVWNYFEAVSKKWPEAWNQIKVEMILNKSTGFVALMKFLKDAYLHLRRGESAVVSKGAFQELFNSIDLRQDSFTKNKYLPGGGGQMDLYRDLLAASHLDKK